MKIDTSGIDAADLKAVMKELDGWLSPTSIPKFLTSPSAHPIGRSSLGVLRRGGCREVFDAIAAQKAGAFA